MFGRGGEEALALIAAGVSFEVVPGMTSAIAAPAVAGIPVTFRDESQCFTVVTGHEDPTGETTVDWEALIAATGGPLVILMGVARLAEITARLRRRPGSLDACRRRPLGHDRASDRHPRHPGHDRGPRPAAALHDRRRRGGLVGPALPLT